MTSPSLSPDTFVVSLPPGWIELPLDPDELVAGVRRDVLQAQPRVPVLDQQLTGGVEYRPLQLVAPRPAPVHTRGRRRPGFAR